MQIRRFLYLAAIGAAGAEGVGEGVIIILPSWWQGVSDGSGPIAPRSSKLFTVEAFPLFVFVVNSYVSVALDVEGEGDEYVADDGGDYAYQRGPALYG